MINVPVIDISTFTPYSEKTHPAVLQLRQACINHGFFYIRGHKVSDQLQEDLLRISRLFFDQSVEEKMKISMQLAGNAWRGYFPLGDELTSGKPDMKEGLYFGIEHQEDDPHVKNEVVMYGKNLFPDNIPGFANIILNYMEEVTHLGHRLMNLMALSLDLDSDYFNKNGTEDPWTLFRIFHYPAITRDMPIDSWGVGEHTDYGVLTILKQDEVGGLQIKSGDSWIDAPYIEGTFICNLGDMFSKMTGGYFQATPHRVKNRSRRGRYSFPFFFDPGWDTEVQSIDTSNFTQNKIHGQPERWDKMKPELFQGTYGKYITMKIGKVFPDLM